MDRQEFQIQLKQRNVCSDNLHKRKGKGGRKIAWTERLILLLLIVVIVGVPYILPRLLYDQKSLPQDTQETFGGPDVWMGFWASYSGAIVTVLVAIISWYNNRAISRLQNSFLDLNTGVNLRLCRVIICPFLDADDQNEYTVKFVFRNISMSIIQNISVRRMIVSLGKESGKKSGVIGQNRENIISDQRYTLRDENVMLEMRLHLGEETLSKSFCEVYNYFSRFPKDVSQLEFEMTMDVIYGSQENAAQKPKSLTVDVVLVPEPGWEEPDFYVGISEKEAQTVPNKFSIVTYNITDAS